MFAYLIKKLEQEYHHLSLWYFVFFFYGIAFYLKSVDLFNQGILLNTHITLYLTILSVLIYFVFFLRIKEKFIFSLFLTILFSFGCGVTIAHFRITNAQIYPKPITKLIFLM